MHHEKFHFTVTDLGRFLDKSPVTLRKWEVEGFVTYPRGASGDRRFEIADVAMVAEAAFRKKRLRYERLILIGNALDHLQAIEKDNH